MAEECYVYIIETTQGAYKIGVANDPDGRYNALLTGIPDPSRLVFSIWCAERRHAFAVEKILHKELSQYHSYGEWFKPPKEVLAVLLFDLGNKIANMSMVIKYPALASLPYREWDAKRGIVGKTNRLICEIRALQEKEPDNRVPCELVIKRFKELGYDESALDRLRHAGDVFEPRPGYIGVMQ